MPVFAVIGTNRAPIYTIVRITRFYSILRSMSEWIEVETTVQRHSEKTSLVINYVITDDRGHKKDEIYVGVGPFGRVELVDDWVPKGWYGICCKGKEVKVHVDDTWVWPRNATLPRKLKTNDWFKIVVDYKKKSPKVKFYFNRKKIAELDIFNADHKQNLMPVFCADRNLRINVFEHFMTDVDYPPVHKMLEHSISDTKSDHFAPSERLQGLAAPIYNDNERSQQQKKNCSVMATECDLSNANSWEPNNLMSLRLRFS